MTAEFRAACVCALLVVEAALWELPSVCVVPNSHRVLKVKR